MKRSIFERLMGMDDASWKRHENPVSGWTRVLILPTLALALWSRVWLGWWSLLPIGALIVFTWLNPRLFPPPEDDKAWMTRGVLGERIWLARKQLPIPAEHDRVDRMLLLVSAIGVAPFAFGLVYYDLPWVIVGLVLMMGGKLWFVDRMVWLYEITKPSGDTGAKS